MSAKHCTFTVNGHRYEIPSGTIPHYLTVYDYLVSHMSTATSDSVVSNGFPSTGSAGGPLPSFRSLKRCTSSPSGGGTLSAVIVVSEVRSLVSSAQHSSSGPIVVTAATGLAGGGGQHVLHRAMDACTTPVLTLHGCAVTTLEALCSPLTAFGPPPLTVEGALSQVGGVSLHPIAARLAASNAGPCGYCSPGLCMLLYALLLNNSQPTTAEIDAALAGVWCRCSGFRGLLDAAHSFASDIDHLLKHKMTQDADAFAANSAENYPPLSEHAVRREVVTSLDRIAALRRLYPALPHIHFKPPIIPTEPPLTVYYGSDGSTFLMPSSVDDVITSARIAPDYTTFSGSEDFSSFVLSKVAKLEGPPLALLYNGRVGEMHDVYLKDMNDTRGGGAAAAAAASSGKEGKGRSSGGGGQGSAADTNSGKKPASFSLFVGSAATFSSLVTQIPKLMHASDVAHRDPWMAAALLELRQAIEHLGDTWVDQQNNTLVSHLLARPCGDLVPLLHALNTKLIALTSRGREEFSVVDVSSASRALGKMDVILGVVIPPQPNRFVCFEKATLRDKRAPAQVAVGLSCDVGRSSGNATSDIFASNFSVSIAGSSFYLMPLPEVESALEKTNLTVEPLRTFRGGLDRLLTTLRNLVHGPSDGRVSYRISVARGLLFRILNRLLLSIGIPPIDASAVSATQPLFYGGGGGGQQQEKGADGTVSSSSGLLGASIASSPPKSPRTRKDTIGGPTRANNSSNSSSIATAVPPVFGVQSWEVTSGYLFASSMEPLELHSPTSDILKKTTNTTTGNTTIVAGGAAGKSIAAAKLAAANAEGLKSPDASPPLTSAGGAKESAAVSAEELAQGASFAWNLHYPLPTLQTDRSPVGDPVMCVNAPRHFAALTEFVADRAPMRGLLHAWFVRSTIPKGVIKQVNTTACKAVQGFLAYFDIRDVPEYGQDQAPSHLASRTSTKTLAQCAGWWEHPTQPDGPNGSSATQLPSGFQVFSDRNVEYVGELIGMVVATTPLAAKRAALAVTMEYVKDHRVAYCLSIQEAREARSYFAPTTDGGTAAVYSPPPNVNDTFVEIVSGGSSGGSAAKGAAPVALRRAMENPAHTVLQGSFSMGGTCTLPTEPLTVLVEPKEGSLVVEATAASATLLQQAVARFVQVPLASVKARVRQSSGDHGLLPCILAAAVGLAARKLNRPVSYQGSLDEDWPVAGRSPAAVVEWRCAYATENASLQALEMTFYLNSGAKRYDSPHLLRTILHHATGAYFVPLVRVKGALCKTNLPPTVATRGLGAPIGMMAMENITEAIAKSAKVPRWRVQAAHLIKPNDTLLHGQVARQVRLQTAWDDLLISANVGERMLRAEQFNTSNRWRKRGIAVLPVLFGAQQSDGSGEVGFATVSIQMDGSVRVVLPCPETGNGLATKVTQLVCRALHTAPSMCVVALQTTTSQLPMSLSAAQRSMRLDIAGAAVLHACEQLAQRLTPLQQEAPSASLSVLARTAAARGISLVATGCGHTSPDCAAAQHLTGSEAEPSGASSSATSSELYPYFTAGAASCEVELDVLTGQHRIVRADVLLDGGVLWNPHLDITAVESAFLQGVGWATTEEVVVGDAGHPDVPEGTMHTTGLRQYNAMRATAMPSDFRVAFVGGQVNERRSIHGAKSCLEDSATCLGGVAFFALRDAVHAARSHWTVENSLPFAELAVPLTAERTRMACFDEFTQATHSGAECVVAGSF